MGHSTHELIAGINRVGNAHAAQMAGEEDRQGAVHFCQRLSESGQNDMDKMLRMARDMDMPKGYWNVRYRNGETGECIGGTCSFRSSPLTPCEVAMDIKLQTFLHGKFKQAFLSPTINHGTMEISLIFQDISLPL
ncbi:MAG: hypothetical protein IIZ38_05080 [Sphingomonas sp.]|uniref:hypothetical protein n=1 Tax=Sphingomonas sp. TaxID=28214 RepID=UPI0025F40F10|nr:hypothetical protein [Sphingomonas sp.]MBQ1497669.1 hypothetical protein [Sphingomonas sp.]MBQ8102759.1 hypothetical protein [Afipia sp.]